MLRRIFIVVPSASMASPVQGAIALANALCKERSVTFVTLKSSSKGYHPFVDLGLDPRVQTVSLGTTLMVPQRLISFRRLLRSAGDMNSVASISFCLSADLLNSFCRDLATTCSSVRGNLPMAYPGVYGKLGKWMIRFHFATLRRLKYVVSMTQSMALVVQQRIGRISPVIGNFVDESLLIKFRREAMLDGPFRFIFTGAMYNGKQPHLVINAIEKLQQQGHDVRLDAYGEGPLLKELKERALNLPKREMIRFHGYVNQPYDAIANSDAIVLPSLTEGVSRSALEALFFGVPCVMRDIDGNAELIHNGNNGFLFHEEDDLAVAMLRAAQLRRKLTSAECLIPPAFRQMFAATQYLHLLENTK